MHLRFLLSYVLLLIGFASSGQAVRWSVGTDPAMWLTGWRNAQVAVQFHPEMSAVAGYGWMGDVDGGHRVALRPRPMNYDAASLFTLGVRFHPLPPEGRRIQGLLGLEFSQESYGCRKVVMGDSESVPMGIQRFSRSDLRLLVGGRIPLVSSLSLSAHAGVGYAVQPDTEWVGAGNGFEAPGITRLLGMELMWGF